MLTPKEIGDKLYDLRAARSMPIKEACRMADVYDNVWMSTEAGEYMPGRTQLRYMLSVFKVSFVDFAGEQDAWETWPVKGYRIPTTRTEPTAQPIQAKPKLRPTCAKCGSLTMVKDGKVVCCGTCTSQL